MNKITLSKKQQGVMSGLRMHAYAVRGIQLFAISLGVWAWLFDNRGLAPVAIMAVVALALQTQLPVLPDWLEKHRPE